MVIPAKEKFKKPKLIAVTADMRKEAQVHILKYNFMTVLDTINFENIQSLIATEVSAPNG